MFMTSNEIKLNLGCGKQHKEGYVNIDIQEPCDLKHDLRTPLPFADDSVDEIFSEGNVISLFSLKEWRDLKKEMARVLKVGGKLEIILLDFEYVLKAFLDNKNGERWGLWWLTIFSGQENEYNFAKNGFTYEKLVADLFDEGMVNFSRKREIGGDPRFIHLICYKQSHDQKIKETMKILIGTPIHECKDYAMERWLENVSKLEYPADFMMVDNSPGLEYVEKVKGYCTKYGIKNYKIEHLEINQAQGVFERVAHSRGVVIQEILSHDYDAWFTWECDQLIPTNALGKLIELMKMGNFMIVNPNSWNREIPGQPNTEFGLSLINRKCLEKYGFLLGVGAEPDMPNRGDNDTWFKKRILKDGGNYIDIFGVIDPVYYLNE